MESEKEKPFKLPPKKEKFCQTYLRNGLNGREAAIEVGFAESNASVAASRMLKMPAVAERIKELQALAIPETLISVKDVIEGLKEVAERCMQRRPVMVMDYKLKRPVHKVDEEGNGVYEFDSSGANRALELLGKHAGAFERDNAQKRAVINIGQGIKPLEVNASKFDEIDFEEVQVNPTLPAPGNTGSQENTLY